MEYSIVNKRRVSQTETIRLDAEYYENKYLKIMDLVEKNYSNFVQLETIGLKVNASAFYPSLEPYYNQGEIPFIRVQDTDDKIDYDNCVKIPENIVNSKEFETLKLVDYGDIVITKGGSIARIGFIKQKSAACRDLIYINSSILSDIEYKFLYFYCLTYIYKNLLIQSASMTAQPHLTLTLVKKIPIYNPSVKFKNVISKLFDKIVELDDISKQKYNYSKSLFLTDIGMIEWKAENKLSFIKYYSTVSSSNRIDAEYFQPKYDEIIKNISAQKHTLLGKNYEILRNSGIKYNDTGKIGVIKTKQITERYIDFNTEDRICQSANNLIIQNRDVIFASMGVGSLGKANIYYEFEDKNKYTIDSTLKIFRPKDNCQISPEYIELYLHTMIAQELIYQNIVGSSGIISIYDSYLKNLPVPIIEKSKEDIIAKNIKIAHLSNFQSKSLFTISKRAVEISIEENEEIALNWIDKRLKDMGLKI